MCHRSQLSSISLVRVHQRGRVTIATSIVGVHSHGLFSLRWISDASFISALTYSLIVFSSQGWVSSCSAVGLLGGSSVRQLSMNSIPSSDSSPCSGNGGACVAIPIWNMIALRRYGQSGFRVGVSYSPFVVQVAPRFATVQVSVAALTPILS